MNNRKIKLRVSKRQKNVLSQAAKVLTVMAVLTTTLVLYNVVINSKTSIAGEIEKTINKLDGFAYQSQLELNTLNLGIRSKFLQIPLLAEIQAEELKYYTKGGIIQHEQGADICFTSEDGKQIIPHAIHRYDPSKGKLLVWIKMPVVDPDKKVILNFYAGKLGAQISNESDVFSNPYKGIFHLNNDFAESIVRQSHGEIHRVNDEEGIIAACKSFSAYSASHANMHVPQLTNHNGNLTVSFWIKPSELSGKSIPLMQVGSKGGFAFQLNSDKSLIFEIRNSANKSAEIKSLNKLKSNEWSQITGVFDASRDSLYLYVNGIIENRVRSGIRYFADGKLTFGGGNGYYFDGQLDELHIAYEPFSGDKVKLLYVNQSNPSALFNVNSSDSNLSKGILAFESVETQPRNGHVLISWSTSFEKNVDLFKIERSTDGEHFEKIAAQFATGSEMESKSYFVIDPNPLAEKTFYRVIGVGFKGENVYSPLSEVDYQEFEKPVVIDAVEPNPFDQSFEVKYKLSKQEKGLLSITNIHGQKVHEALLDPEKEKYAFDHGNKLLPGIYFICLKQDNEQHTLRLVKKAKQ
ncbi:MAG: DUF2341 domain-containing protein [Flavobacteriales bacterium]